ncbi:hypothetical protein, partial [Escherichia coli]|uniref:hypothetical protein n=1 Tax=Escherichia coli TaxID=562 RepID=UPI0032E4E3E7
TVMAAPTFPPLKDPGIAEIKPHNLAAIRQGLYQLQWYLRESEFARGKPAPGVSKRASWIIGAEPERASVWLITYTPLPEGSRNPSQLRIIAHQLDRGELLKDRRKLPKNLRR